MKSSQVVLNVEEVGRLRNWELTRISGAANSIGEGLTIKSSDRCHSKQPATKRMKKNNNKAGKWLHKEITKEKESQRSGTQDNQTKY